MRGMATTSPTTDKTLGEYIIQFARTDIPEQRQGQMAFNLLTVMHPVLAERIRGSVRDPFYRDERLPEFFDFVGVFWDSV